MVISQVNNLDLKKKMLQVQNRCNYCGSFLNVKYGKKTFYKKKCIDNIFIYYIRHSNPMWFSYKNCYKNNNRSHYPVRKFIPFPFPIECGECKMLVTFCKNCYDKHKSIYESWKSY